MEKEKKHIYMGGTLLAGVLLALSLYINETKAATNWSIAALQETLRWFQVANVLSILGLTILIILILTRFFKE